GVSSGSRRGKEALLTQNDVGDDEGEDKDGEEGEREDEQLSHKLQCEALGGLKILQVKQYFSLTVCPLISTSLVLGGGRELTPLTPLAASVNHKAKHAEWHSFFLKNNNRPEFSVFLCSQSRKEEVEKTRTILKKMLHDE
ncbi:uncharacterized, partial [Tachysurus ichikawai]